MTKKLRDVSPQGTTFCQAHNTHMGKWAAYMMMLVLATRPNSTSAGGYSAAAPTGSMVSGASDAGGSEACVSAVVRIWYASGNLQRV